MPTRLPSKPAPQDYRRGRALSWPETARFYRLFARASYYATRSLRTLIAVGRGPIPRTLSGVPAIPPMPVLCR
ncbi:hypothetical protein [Methylobacterium sp. J-077]|uniref:hypothetical protein n=1 Tax=Methylobacterium sp. J-077 TaxID=2836656 RepID=UPI001FBA327A|nr:hypothetical protein [Methylobacterium sp. J-077]MCJ2124351.1 hypothetical protein [Methylobacterium sp. J-077]